MSEEFDTADLDIKTQEFESRNTELYKSVDESKYVVFYFEFENWEPNHFHWNVPSHMTIWNDGSWLIYSEHIAHQNPDAGYRGFYVDLQFYDSADRNIHANSYQMARIRHRDQFWAVSTEGRDLRFAQFAPQIVLARGRRSIRR